MYIGITFKYNKTDTNSTNNINILKYHTLSISSLLDSRYKKSPQNNGYIKFKKDNALRRKDVNLIKPKKNNIIIPIKILKFKSPYLFLL